MATVPCWKYDKDCMPLRRVLNTVKEDGSSHMHVLPRPNARIPVALQPIPHSQNKWLCRQRSTFHHVIPTVKIIDSNSILFVYLLYRKNCIQSIQCCISRRSKTAKIKCSKLQAWIYALAHLNLPTVSFKCIS